MRINEKNSFKITIIEYANYIVSLFENINLDEVKKIFLGYENNKVLQKYLKFAEEVRLDNFGKYIYDRLSMEIKIFIARVLEREKSFDDNTAILKIRSMFCCV
jgi:hypothetical protein